ncbi:MAG: NAD(P)H-dependent oxidoreductase subunit E [Sphingomonadales bacterium]
MVVTSEQSILDDIIGAHMHREGALLPILHDIQAAFGHISEAAIRSTALTLNLSRAEVSGVVSFYHDFRRTADPRPAIRLCRAEACQARGSEPLAAHAERVAGSRVHVGKVYCLGLCSAGPNAIIGDMVYARLDQAAVTDLIGAL